jgi:pyruvate dehydrogenase E1 component alpha subunit
LLEPVRKMNLGISPGQSVPENLHREWSMLATMILIREFEEQAHACLERGFIAGPVHQSIGQEAVPVGVCAQLRKSDLIQSNHRGHGHALAKGADPVAMMKELFGRVGGTNGGKGGSMHIADFSVGMMGANGILADGVTMGVGAAQAAMICGRDQVVGAFVGDGTTNRGPFYEGLNWAKVFKLPLLLICEDNQYASSTQTSSITAGAGPAARARAFDIPAVSVDGNDLRAVDRAAAELVARIRAGEGPQFLHAVTHRIKGHISRDGQVYRRAGEPEEWFAKEPISRFERTLLSEGVSAADISALHELTREKIAHAVAAAEAAPIPDPRTAFDDVQDIGAVAWPN